MGDGLLATFESTARAIRCAQALRRGFVTLDLPVRIGLHTGEVELLGEDVAGITVNIAGRVCSLAQADEILVSQAVRNLARRSAMTFSERGHHRLRGLPDRWTLYAVG